MTRYLLLILLLMLFLFNVGSVEAQRRIHSRTQGFSFKAKMNNLGVIGGIAYYRFPEPLGGDSLGFEFPIGDFTEHIYGAGLWIGGRMDTSSLGGGSPIALTSVTYEGWSGPYYELYPGTTPGDSFWTATRRDSIPPEGWNEYWGGALPFNPRSDRDYYCFYRDDSVRVSGHVPMHIKVVQSSFAWDESQDSPILVLEYRLMSTWRRTIEDLYFGFFLDGNVGPIDLPSYWTKNFFEYDNNVPLASIHNPLYPSVTPIGLSILETPAPVDSLRVTVRSFPGVGTPPTDAQKHLMLQSGLIDTSGFANLGDIQFVVANGPFRLHPPTDPHPDTLVFVVAIVSGQNTTDMKHNVSRARELYQTNNSTVSSVGRRKRDN